MSSNTRTNESYGIRCANGHIVIPGLEAINNKLLTKQDFFCTQCNWTRAPLDGIYEVDQLPEIIKWLKIYAAISVVWILINIIFSLAWGWWIIPILTLTGSIMRYRGNFFTSDFRGGKFNIQKDTDESQAMQAHISYCSIIDGVDIESKGDILPPIEITGDFKLNIFATDGNVKTILFNDLIKNNYKEKIMPFINQLHDAGYLLY